MFHVGQKVVRIGVPDNMIGRGHAFLKDRPDTNLTEVGSIYRIKTLNIWPQHTLLTFHELDNSHLIGIGGSKYEPGFDARGFRPLIERKTDISALLALLNPANHKYLERA